MAKSVYLGMSGGVDSAASAALLLESGYDVRGIYMRNWSRDLPGFSCPWAKDLADAERVCTRLGIDLEVWDYEEEYKKTVVDYLVDAYAKGYTPNPDVMCNETIKFGSFARRALAEGADYIATGHYARSLEDGTLLRARDEHKDQTYFLWRVDQSYFAKTIFPVGDFATKDEVRKLCAKRGLGIENKADSDGICFIGPVGIRTFLLDSLERRVGDIIEWETGNKLGEHDGAFLFTIGQRKGINVGGGPARYVVATDTEKNVVYVSADKMCPELWQTELLLEDMHWIAGVAPEAKNYQVRLRHTGALREAYVDPIEGRVVFREAQSAVAPGQSCVVYDGYTCLGGGIIAKRPLELAYAN